MVQKGFQGRHIVIPAYHGKPGTETVAQIRQLTQAGLPGQGKHPVTFRMTGHDIQSALAN
jgi:hypothetical protein